MTIDEVERRLKEFSREENFQGIKALFIDYITSDGTCYDPEEHRKPISNLRLLLAKREEGMMSGLRQLDPNADDRTKEIMQRRVEIEKAALSEAIVDLIDDVKISPVSAAKFATIKASGTGMRGYRIVEKLIELAQQGLNTAKRASLYMLVGALVSSVGMTLLLDLINTTYDVQYFGNKLFMLVWGVIGAGLGLEAYEKAAASGKFKDKERK